MDGFLGIIIAIVGGVVAIVGVMIALFLWTRGEASADRRHFDIENKELRRELIDVMRSIDAEFKDFHGRLCEIEARAANVTNPKKEWTIK
jgi:Flp pilus assembly protein TadB